MKGEKVVMNNDFLDKIQGKFRDIVNENELLEKEIIVSCGVLTPQEAIGDPGRGDFPIQKGKEKLMQAGFGNSYGQAFTDMPAVWQGKLGDLVTIPLTTNSNRAIFISGMNGVLKDLAMAEHTVHCKDQGLGRCSQELVTTIKKEFGQPRIALFGLQPAMAEALLKEFNLRIFDLDADNIGQTKFGIVIEDGICNLAQVEEWADIFLVTGSTLCNNSIGPFLEIKKPVIFFGTTIAGTAKLLGLKWFCPESV